MTPEQRIAIAWALLIVAVSARDAVRLARDAVRRRRYRPYDHRGKV